MLNIRTSYAYAIILYEAYFVFLWLCEPALACCSGVPPLIPVL
jgi:hypothetical protein